MKCAFVSISTFFGKFLRILFLYYIKLEKRMNKCALLMFGVSCHESKIRSYFIFLFGSLFSLNKVLQSFYKKQIELLTVFY